MKKRHADSRAYAQPVKENSAAPGCASPPGCTAGDIGDKDICFSGANNQRYCLYERSSVGLAVLEPDSWRFIEVNERMTDITGYTHDELLQLTHLGLLDPQDRQAELLLATSIREGKRSSWFSEKRYRRKDGSLAWVRINGCVQRDSDGRGMRHLAAVEDVTASKMAAQALRDSEEQFRVAFSRAGVGLVIAQPDGCCHAVNDRYCEITGMNRPDLLATHFLQRIHPIHRGETRQCIKGLLDNQRDFFKSDLLCVRQDGEVRWVRLTASLLRQPSWEHQEEPQHLLCVVEDIHRQKEAEEELARLNNHLQEEVARQTSVANERAGMLQRLTLELTEAEDRERRRLSEILHDDLQQLLVGAQMHLRAVADSLPEQLPAFSVISSLLDNCVRKSRDLSHDLSPPALHQSGLVEGLRWLADYSSGSFGLHINVKAETIREPAQDSLRTFLYRAVQELLLNVVKHARAEHACIEVSERDRVLIVTVSDDGRGMNGELMNACCHQQGLGLFSIRERIGILGGELKVARNPSGGCRVSLCLPHEVMAAHRGANGDSSTSSCASGRDGRAGTATVLEPEEAATAPGVLRVLLVDDHLVMREGLVALLQGHPDIKIVGKCSNGREAVHQTQLLRPDVVVMDIMMPIMDGIEATRLIHQEHDNVRIVALSMHEHDHMAAKMVDAGAAVYLSKSGPTEALLRAIRGDSAA